MNRYTGRVVIEIAFEIEFRDEKKALEIYRDIFNPGGELNNLVGDIVAERYHNQDGPCPYADEGIEYTMHDYWDERESPAIYPKEGNNEN